MSQLSLNECMPNILARLSVDIVLSLVVTRYVLVPMIHILFRWIEEDLRFEASERDTGIERIDIGIPQQLSQHTIHFISLASVLIGVVVTLSAAGWMENLALFVFAWSLLAIAVIDRYTGIIPFEISAPLVAAGVLSAAVSDTSIISSLQGAVAGMGIVIVTRLVSRWITGQDGIGLGDGYLLAALGAWLGMRSMPGIVTIAAALCLAYVAWMRLVHRRLMTNVVFGPALCIATFLYFVFPLFQDPSMLKTLLLQWSA